MFLLNFYNTIITCSFIFVTLMLIISALPKIFGTKKTYKAILLAIGLNVISFTNYNYCINGQYFEYLVLASLLSVLLSSIALIKTTAALKNKASTFKRIFLGLVSAITVDGITMAIYFSKDFSSSIVSRIFLEEVSFKILFTLIILGTIKIAVTTFTRYNRIRSE